MTQSNPEQMYPEQVPVITDAPEPQFDQPQVAHPQGTPEPTPEPEGVRLSAGDVMIFEGDTQYKIPDTAGAGAFDEIPRVRRSVMAARLRSIADLLD